MSHIVSMQYSIQTSNQIQIARRETIEESRRSRPTETKKSYIPHQIEFKKWCDQLDANGHPRFYN